jgi:hypothetical protein
MTGIKDATTEGPLAFDEDWQGSLQIKKAIKIDRQPFIPGFYGGIKPI